MITIILNHPIVSSTVIFIIIFLAFMWYQKKYSKNDEKKSSSDTNDEKKYDEYIKATLVAICVAVIFYIFLTIKSTHTSFNHDNSNYDTDTSSSVGEYLDSLRKETGVNQQYIGDMIGETKTNNIMPQQTGGNNNIDDYLLQFD